MGWLVVLVVGLVVFAAAFDLVSRARGRYRPTSVWEAGRAARKTERASLSIHRRR